MNAQDWFGGLGGASASRGGNYFAPGTYRVKVEDVIRRVSENPNSPGSRYFIVEATILEVLDSFPAEKDADGKGFDASNKAGERCSQVVDLTKNPKTALGNVKNFLCAALGVTEGSFTDEEWTAVAFDMSDPSKPVEDRIGELELIVVAGKTFTRAGNPFTPLRWNAIPDLGDAENSA